MFQKTRRSGSLNDLLKPYLVIVKGNIRWNIVMIVAEEALGMLLSLLNCASLQQWWKVFIPSQSKQ